METDRRDDRIAVLTATCDQVQADVDRLDTRLGLALLAVIMIGAAVWLQQKQLETVIRRVRAFPVDA